MRDENQTGYAPIFIPGVTPNQRIAVEARSVPCDGEVAGPGLGHPRIWLRIPDREITCPYCSITYVLKADADDADGH